MDGPSLSVQDKRKAESKKKAKRTKTIDDEKEALGIRIQVSKEGKKAEITS